MTAKDASRKYGVAGQRIGQMARLGKIDVKINDEGKKTYSVKDIKAVSKMPIARPNKHKNKKKAHVIAMPLTGSIGEASMDQGDKVTVAFMSVAQLREMVLQ